MYFCRFSPKIRCKSEPKNGRKLKRFLGVLVTSRSCKFFECSWPLSQMAAVLKYGLNLWNVYFGTPFIIHILWSVFALQVAGLWSARGFILTVPRRARVAGLACSCNVAWLWSNSMSNFEFDRSYNNNIHCTFAFNFNNILPIYVF